MDRRDVEPVRGCTKITPGCDHCYAETFAERFRGVPGHPYEQGFDLRLVPEKLAEPLRWKTPKMIFVNSMSDLFHEGRARRLRRGRLPRDGTSQLAHLPGADQAVSRLRDMLQTTAAVRRRPAPHLVGRQRRGPSPRPAPGSSTCGQAPAARPVPVHRAAAGGPRRDQPGRNPLGDRRRRERAGRKADAEGVGALASGISASEPRCLSSSSSGAGSARARPAENWTARRTTGCRAAWNCPSWRVARRLAAIAEIERLYQPANETTEPSLLFQLPDVTH